MNTNVHLRPISWDWCNQSDDPGDLDGDDEEEEEVNDGVDADDDDADDEDKYDGILVFPETRMQTSKLN